MKRVKRTIATVIFVASTLSLFGCGGGGGGDSSGASTASTSSGSGGTTSAATTPVASAGSDQTVAMGAPVSLSGACTSADTAVVYCWTFTSIPAGSKVTLDNPASATPSFVPDVEGAYVLKLIVNNGKADSEPSTVTIKAKAGTTGTAPGNTSPTSYKSVAIGSNDATWVTSTGTSATIYPKTLYSSGCSRYYCWWNGVVKEILYGVVNTTALVELGLAPVPAGGTVSKAILHVYISSVVQQNNADECVATLYHIRNTSFTGDAGYDYGHLGTNVTRILNFAPETPTGWTSFDVTELVKGDIAAGAKWSGFYLAAYPWRQDVNILREKSVTFISADYQQGAYAPYLEME